MTNAAQSPWIGVPDHIKNNWIKRQKVVFSSMCQSIAKIPCGQVKCTFVPNKESAKGAMAILFRHLMYPSLFFEKGWNSKTRHRVRIMESLQNLCIQEIEMVIFVQNWFWISFTVDSQQSFCNCCLQRFTRFYGSSKY